MNNTKTEFKLTTDEFGLCKDCLEVVKHDLKIDYPFLMLYVQTFIMAARVCCVRCGYEDTNHPEYAQYKAMLQESGIE
jgi:hypothetical protein